MTTLQSRTQDAYGKAVDRPYRLATILISVTIALIIGIVIGFAVSTLTSPSSAGLSSVSSVDGSEPRQGGR